MAEKIESPGCACESCKTLHKLDVAGYVELLDQQVASEAQDTVRTREAAIAAAAELRGREWLPRAQEAARRVERLYHHPIGDEHMGNAIAGLLLALGLEG